MNQAIQLLGRIWNALPGSLRRFIGYGVASGTAMAIVLAVYLIWGTGYIQDKLGVMVTRKDLQDQQVVIKEGTEQNMAAMSSMIQDSISSLKGWIANERALAVDTTLVPLVRAVYGLSRDVRTIKQELGITKDRVEAIPAEVDQKLRQYVEEHPPDRLDRMARDQEEFQRRVMERLDEIDHGKKRITKSKF